MSVTLGFDPKKGRPEGDLRESLIAIQAAVASPLPQLRLPNGEPLFHHLVVAADAIRELLWVREKIIEARIKRGTGE